MTDPVVPANQNYSLLPEWELTKQSAQLGIRHCRHNCSYGKGSDGKWNFKDEHTLGLFLSPRPFHFWHKQDSRTYTGFYSKGDLLITPSDTTLFTQADGDVQIVQVRIRDSLLRNVAEESLAQNGDRVELIQNFQTRDPQIEAILMMLLNELHQASFGSQLYIDSLANALAVHLLRQHGMTKPQLPIYHGGLPQRQLLRVLDYIDAHLDRKLKLAELAQLLDISQFHFGRLFRQSLGLSPYQYLLQQRVERAKQLLKQTDKSIVDIAFDCGFNSHSHLSKQFRQSTGMTPKAYRAS